MKIISKTEEIQPYTTLNVSFKAVCAENVVTFQHVALDAATRGLWARGASRVYLDHVRSEASIKFDTSVLLGGIRRSSCPAWDVKCKILRGGEVEGNVGPAPDADVSGWYGTNPAPSDALVVELNPTIRAAIDCPG